MTALLSLPSIEPLRLRAKSVALLDAILSPEWQYRLYYFDPVWSDTEQMASLNDGQGNDLFIVFAPVGCFILGFDHESIMSPWGRDDKSLWPGIFDGVPAEFLPMVNEPAFSSQKSSTFCYWRLRDDKAWSSGPVILPEDVMDPDGSEWLLSIFLQGAEEYKKYASEYFEVEIDLALIEHIYAHQPLTPEIISALNAEADTDSVMAEALKIGYGKH